MKFTPAKPLADPRRRRIQEGCVFSFPVAGAHAVGVVCDKNINFFAAILDALWDHSEPLETFLPKRCAFAGAWTTDALIYHGLWEVHGTVDPAHMPACVARPADGSSDALHVCEPMTSVCSVQHYALAHQCNFVGASSYSPAAVQRMVRTYFEDRDRSGIQEILLTAP